MARSITTRSTNPKIIDDNIKILDDALASASDAENIAYDNTDSGLTADDVQAAIDEISGEINKSIIVSNYDCTGVAATSDSSGWYYADYTFELSKTYTNGVAVTTSQRGVPYITEADVRNGNQLVIRVWAMGTFGTTTQFTIRTIISEAS